LSSSADRLFDLAEALLDDLAAADDARDGARHLAEQVVRGVDGLLARRECVGNGLDGLEARVQDGHRRIQMQCWTLGGSMATLGKMPW